MSCEHVSLELRPKTIVI